MKLSAKVTVCVADAEHCSAECQYLGGSKMWGAVWCILWRAKDKTCLDLRLSRDGRAVRCGQCRKSTGDSNG